MNMNQTLKIEKPQTDQIMKAVIFASEKHIAQKRKNLPWPYIVHIYEVAEILQENGASQETVVAGILHDTVEDTNTTLEQIAQNFGYYVASIVDVLSEDKSLPYATRKEVQAQRIKVATKEAKMVKCADCLSNLRSLYYDSKRDENVWSKFNSTKENIQIHYRRTIEAIGELDGFEMYKELQRYYDGVFGEKIENFSENLKTQFDTSSQQVQPNENVSEEKIENLLAQPKGKIKQSHLSPFVYVNGKKISDCTQCLFMERRITPDPDDWFNDDDQEYSCSKSGKVISRLNRPYEKQPIPENCPYREK